MPSIADTYVTIFPETSKIAVGIKAAFLKVDDDAREAGGRWGKEIEKGIGEVKVSLGADTTKAKAEIDEAARDRHSTIHVDVDRSQTSQLESAIDGSMARAGERGGINMGQSLVTSFGESSPRLASAASSAGAQAGSSMGAALGPVLMAAGITAIAGIASAASGLAGLIPAVLGGAGLGIGTLVIGLDGVKDAWDAVGKASKDSGADQAAKAKEVTSATRSLNAAVKDEAQAQKDVATARKDARQQLEDLNLELRGGAIDEKQAQLDALKARQDLATGTYQTSLDYEQAQLRVIEADQRVDEAHQRSSQLQAKAADERAKGVDGADQVVAANNRLADTQDRVSQAQQGLDAANGKVSSSAKDAATAMAALSPAGQALVTTLQGMMPQFQAFKFAIQDALLTGLGPQIQQLATTYLPVLQGAMTQMATSMNQAFGSLAQLFQTPEMLSAMQSILNNITSSFATWSQSISPIAQAFTKITEVGSSFLPQLAQGAVNAANGFNQFITEASKSGQLRQWIQTGINSMQQLGDILKSVFNIFLSLSSVGSASLSAIQQLMAGLQPIIAQLAPAFANLVKQLTPFLNMVVGMVKDSLPNLIKGINQVADTFKNLTPAIQAMWNIVGPIFETMVDLLNKMTSPLMLINGIADAFTGKGSAADNARQGALLRAQNAARAAQGLPPLDAATTDTGAPITTPGVTSPGGTTPFVIPGAPGATAGDRQRAQRGTATRLGWGDADPRTWQWGGPPAAPGSSTTPPVSAYMPPGVAMPPVVGPGGSGTSPNGFKLFAPEQSFAVNGVSTQGAAGAPAQRLQAFAQWFNDNIEPVKQFAGYDAGGHGLGTKSNHASGTALDINWDDFTALQGNGADARTHFSPAQMQEISQQLAQMGMTWGQYWTPGSRDPGHFELGGASYDKGAQNIAGGSGGAPVSPGSAPVTTSGMPGVPTGQPTDPMYIALSPNIPAGQQAKSKGDKDSSGNQLGQDFMSGIGEIFGLGDLFPDPTQFGLFKIFKGLMGLKFKDGGGAGSDGSLSGGGGGGGGGGGVLGGILSAIPQAFGDLNIGSPKDAPGQFMPSVPGSGGGVVLPGNLFASPNSPTNANSIPGPGNAPSVDLSNSHFGYSPTQVQDQIQQGQIQAVRQPLRALP